MTTVYGVTPYGARLQIEGQLKDLEEFPQDQVNVAKHYLTEKTFLSLEKMFTSARQIQVRPHNHLIYRVLYGHLSISYLISQDWFVLLANLITRVRGDLLTWTTPLDWPVVQYYSVTRTKVDKQTGQQALFLWVHVILSLRYAKSINGPAIIFRSSYTHLTPCKQGRV